MPEPNDDPEGDDLPQEGQDEVPGDDDELGEKDPSGEDLGLNDLAEVLTVTARKLAAVTQGRKFSGQPKRSLADKKRNSICAGCGNKGHWANDDECPLNQNQSGSSSAAPKRKGKGHKGRDDRGAVDAKKVMTVFHNTGFDSTIEYIPDDTAPNHHFAMVCTAPIFSCLTTSFQDSFGYMIMDTACQRACCGQMWMDGHEKLLKEFSLKVFYEESNEHFQFGSGQPVETTQKAWIPAGLEQHCLSFGVNVLPSEIPFLGSLKILNSLGSIIDLNQRVVHFSTIGVTCPLKRVCGHLAVEICVFPPRPHRLSIWSKLFESGFTDPEIAHVCLLKADAQPDSFLSSPLDGDILQPPSASHGTGLRPGVAAALEASMPAAPSPGSRSGGACVPGQAAGGVERQGLQEHHGQGRDHGRPQEQGEDASETRQSVHSCQIKDSIIGSGIKQYSSQGLPRQEPDRVPTPNVQATRQPARKLCNVHGTHGTLEVGRPRLETAWLLLQVVTAATVFLDDGGWFHQASRVHGRDVPSAATTGLRASSTSSTSAGSVPKGSGSHDDFRTNATGFDGPWNFDGNYGGRVLGQDWFTKVKATLDDLFSGRTHEAIQPDAGLRCGIHRSGGTRGGGDGQHLQLAPGKRKRLVGEVKKATKALWPEVLVVNDIPSEKNKPHYVDVFELFAGSAKATLFAKKYGLNALEPYELADVKDLCDKKVESFVLDALRRMRPLLLLIGFPCTEFCIMNENCNYALRPEELELRRALMRPALKWVCKLCQEQAASGRYYILENPLRSRLWQEACVKELYKVDNTEFVNCDGGAFGAVDLDGFPIIKTYGFLLNCPKIARALDRRLSPQERQVCKPLEGANVTASQVYPDDLVHAILRALRKTAQLLSPGRFDET